MKSTISKSLMYLLGTNTLEEKECNSIMRLILNTVLRKAYIYRKFLLNICYGSSKMLGLGFEDLFIHQGYDQIVFFLEQRYSNSLSTLLLNICYE